MKQNFEEDIKKSIESLKLNDLRYGKFIHQ